MSLSGNANGMKGTIYARAAQLSLSGNGVLQASLVVDNLRLSGNAASSVTAGSGSGAPGAPGSILASSQLLSGVVWDRGQRSAIRSSSNVLSGGAGDDLRIGDSGHDVVIGGYGIDESLGHLNKDLLSDRYPASDNTHDYRAVDMLMADDSNSGPLLAERDRVDLLMIGEALDEFLSTL